MPHAPTREPPSAIGLFLDRRKNALHLVPLAKQTIVRVKSIPEAGHYAFLSPFSGDRAKEVPDFCTNPEAWPAPPRTCASTRTRSPS